MYLCAGLLLVLATLSLSVVNWVVPSLDPDTSKTIRLLPLVSIIMMYTAFGAGYCPIVYILQGKTTMTVNII